MQSPLRNRWRMAELIVALFAAASAAMAQLGSPVDDWTVPDIASKAQDVTSPVTFVGMRPCRIVDTRGPVGSFGGPVLPANTERNFDLDSGPCTGIPAGVEAYSLNFTVTQTQGFGDLRVWPFGQSPPLVSTLNFVPNQTVANAAIVPAGFEGGISVVAAVSGTHLIIDINGYFTGQSNDSNAWIFSVSEEGAAALFVTNSETVGAGSSGVAGATNSSGAGSYGVVGRNNTTSGENGGVHGRAAGAFPGLGLYGQAGVRGESFFSFGVLGITANTIGVAGSNVDEAGTETAWGGLACFDTQAVCGMGTLNVTGTKSFVEPHPADAAKVIEYVSLEGPEAGTYFRGRARFSKGIARIAIPESFRMVTAEEGLSIQVTPIGEMATYAVVRIDLNEIVVKASRNVEFFYTVNGVRKGYEEFSPISEKEFFAPRSAASKLPGALSPEAKRKLIANGTYNADGTVNMETAKRLGWTGKWRGSPGANHGREE